MKKYFVISKQKFIVSGGMSGFSMLEMMVAILILALGLLGVAGMEAATAKYRINIQSNAAAAQLFTDLSERIRANPDAAGPSFDPTGGTGISQYLLNNKKYADQQTENLSASVDCGSNVCTSDQRAAYDMVEWRKLVKSSLPQGAAWIEGDKKSGFNVTLMWMDKGQTDDPTDGTAKTLQKADECQADTKAEVFNCCPKDANVIAGVKCTRVALFP